MGIEPEIRKYDSWMGMVLHVCNPSTWTGIIPAWTIFYLSQKQKQRRKASMIPQTVKWVSILEACDNPGTQEPQVKGKERKI